MKYIFSLCLYFVFLGACFAKEAIPYEFYGRHLMTQYYDCDETALSNISQLNEIMKQATLASGATLLKTIDYSFEPSGYTLVLLLSESHASIHTYPEHRSCFIDFFTCGRHCSAEKFETFLRDYLQPKKIVSELRERK